MKILDVTITVIGDRRLFMKWAFITLNLTIVTVIWLNFKLTVNSQNTLFIELTSILCFQEWVNKIILYLYRYTNLFINDNGMFDYQ